MEIPEANSISDVYQRVNAGRLNLRKHRSAGLRGAGPIVGPDDSPAKERAQRAAQSFGIKHFASTVEHR
jgi:hypothetical protein